MNNGYLKSYFKGIIVKKLSAVEIMPRKSNQHEFNATRGMRVLFGEEDRKYKATFLYIDDEQSFSAEEYLTWYDARRNHPTRTEYRLYYPSTQVSQSAAEGDSLFICVKQDETLLCIVSQKDATITSQLYWLFDINPSNADHFIENDKLETDGNQLEFTVKTILGQIGIEYEYHSDETLLDSLIATFGTAFPKTEVFSAYARSMVKDADPESEPDKTLMRWYDQEEKLFYLMEKQIVKERLKQGFGRGTDVDVDGFISYSLSVQNRRKSRAGLAFENHIAALFDANKISYSHTPVTENHSKPDFLFPDIKCYFDKSFPTSWLTVLGAKSTCKDRWRQVLSEADRIQQKHLITFEAAISKYQTDEMRDKKLQLVVPEPIHGTYTMEQQQWLYSVKQFLAVIKEKQNYYKNSTR